MLVYEGVTLAEGVVISTFSSIFPLPRLAGLDLALKRTSSVTEALAETGVADYVRAETRITAESASPTQAMQLGLRPGQPVLRAESLNTLPDGTPVERGTALFAGEKVTIVVGDDATSA